MKKNNNILVELSKKDINQLIDLKIEKLKDECFDYSGLDIYSVNDAFKATTKLIENLQTILSELNTLDNAIKSKKIRERIYEEV